MRVAILSSLAAALLLSGCVVPTGPVEVTRFNRVAEGAQYGSGSYSVRLADQAALTDEGNAGSGGELAASPYLAAVSREMQRAGYSEASGGSDVVAEVSVTVRDLGKSNHAGRLMSALADRRAAIARAWVSASGLISPVYSIVPKRGY